ncbi:MAG: HlyD family efflux transporter periplasmic adaptor subunit [Planctomycetaceae bacterium]|nr:HlyD family efflux transporter periplasmic adaptor subunit [Planctomycetaceae bacterium]
MRSFCQHACRGIGPTVVGCFLLTAIAYATEPKRTGEIVLVGCRVKIIDQIPLASDRAGVLSEMNLREGDPITGRQRVARIRDDVIQAQLAIAEQKANYTAEVSAKDKAYLIAVNEYRQAVNANRETARTVPEIEVERLKLAAELASFEIEKAKQDLQVHKLERDQASAELQAYGITAPFSGVVTKIFKKRGEAVRQGDPVIELTSTERVRVDGWLELPDSFRVSQGMPVKVQLDIENYDLPEEKQIFDGRVTFVDVVVEPTGEKVKISAEVVNHDNILRAGLTARMSIIPGTAAVVTPVSGTAKVKP